MTTHDAKMKLYGLIDGAQYPEMLGPLAMEFAREVRTLFDGMPEEEAGNASPFLVQIDDIDAEWVTQIDELDILNPCLSLIRSVHDIDTLWAHLRHFLFADIGDGMTGLVRFFDPRALPAILDVCGEEVSARLVQPMAAWLYRGHTPNWQRVDVDSLHEGFIAGTSAFSLNQRQLDELERRCEPDALMSVLAELGKIDISKPFAMRYDDFMARYVRALEWRLASSMDRLSFCAHSFEHGARFDQNQMVREAIEAAVDEGRPLNETFMTIPTRVWDHLRPDSVEGSGTPHVA